MVIKMGFKKLVYGVGINDAEYEVYSKDSGARVVCKFYKRWCDMLKRCYSKKYKSTRQTYEGCIVCSEWLIFSNFKTWMVAQDWDGKELDKDILVKGNKIYSPDTCAFVDRLTNNFTTDSAANRGEWPNGVYWCKIRKMFMAQCSNFNTKKKDRIGPFDCPNKAHQAWKKRKHELACQLAGMQTDERLANALRLRYAP